MGQFNFWIAFFCAIVYCLFFSMPYRVLIRETWVLKMCRRMQVEQKEGPFFC